MPSDDADELADDHSPERSLAPEPASTPVPKAPVPVEVPSVAVIGAGISGLAAGRALHDRGLKVTVFDKGRGPGGRTSTRHREEGPYDHGAPFFTAEDPRFRSCVAEWLRDGVVAASARRAVRWTPRGHRDPDPAEGPRFSGAPEMSAICLHLAGGLEVLAQERIDAVEPGPRGWTLEGWRGAHGPYDLVVLAIPAPQAVDLLIPIPHLADQVAKVTYDPCLAALVAFATPPPWTSTSSMSRTAPWPWRSGNTTIPKPPAPPAGSFTPPRGGRPSISKGPPPRAPWSFSPPFGPSGPKTGRARRPWSAIAGATPGSPGVSRWNASSIPPPASAPAATGVAAKASRGHGSAASPSRIASWAAASIAPHRHPAKPS